MPSLLRLCTAGSVDDGKSTLIGRLLYDSRALYDDQVRAVETASSHRGVGAIDFSLFTDGLRAEREQGITIDVAYRYFATPRRRFILADTPGHEEYTRNMATGASTADLAIILVDARHGLLAQTHRHLRIARLLGVSSLVLAINKMDLVGFDRDRFGEIAAAFSAAAADAAVQAIPISALHGDNITQPSARLPWYDGPNLLTHLEQVEARGGEADRPFRFPVQLVLRRPPDYRALAGRIASGTVRVGDRVTIAPSGTVAHVARIVTWNGDLDRASASMAVSIVLDRHVDAGRGDVLAAGTPRVTSAFDADVVWMDQQPLAAGRPYLMKHAARMLSATADRSLALNEIGRVRFTTTEPVCIDAYTDNRTTGAFIVIDPSTNFTSGAGMVAPESRA